MSPSTRKSTFPPKPQSLGNRKARTSTFRTSTFRILAFSKPAFVVAFFLFAMSVGVQAHKYFQSIYVLGAFVSGGLAALYLFLPKGGFVQRYRSDAVYVTPAIGLLLVIISAALTAEINPILKSLVLASTFVLVSTRLSGVTPNQLLSGFAMFSVLEVVFVFATRAEWNPNALCNHIMFASLCGAAALSVANGFPARKFFAFTVLLFAATVGIAYQSRTATLALLIVVCSYGFIRAGKVDYRLVRYLGGFCLLAGFIWSGDIVGGITNVAVRNLDSDNPIAEFFLDDKSISKIEEDLFDRKLVWAAATTAMLENPAFGVGYEKELPAISGREFRAHNAYLEIGYQCGILALIVWAVVYYHLVEYSAKLIRRQPRNPLVFLLFTSSAYLMLAGIMESSGMLSAGTPGNWIAIACFVNLKSQGGR